MDLIHNLIPYVSLPIAAYTKSGGAVTGTPVDTQGAERKLILFIGVGHRDPGQHLHPGNPGVRHGERQLHARGRHRPDPDQRGRGGRGAPVRDNPRGDIDNSNAIKMLEYVGSKRFIVANLIAPTGAGTGSGVVGALIILGGLRNSVETP